MNQKYFSLDFLQKRILLIALGIFFLFSLLVAQFYRIQIIEGDKWLKEGRKQHYFVVKEPFIRGRFLSNTSIKKGHPEKVQYFVLDVQKFHLYADPMSIPDENKQEVAAELLARISYKVSKEGERDVGSDSMGKNLFQELQKKSRSRKLAMWLDREDKEEILAWWRPYCRSKNIPGNAIFFINDYQRSYPFGKLLGQVLHTVQHNRDEMTQQAFPTGGLELSLHHYLSGVQGKRLLMRSPRNALEMGEVIAHPEHGADVYLTINHYVQAIVEEELEKGVKKVHAKGGWATMMNPYTGEIIALAQYPFFYPPDYQLFFNDPKLIDHTHLHALTDANEPGSIMKPLTVAIALMANAELKRRGESPLFHPEEKIATADGRFPGRKQPIKDTSLHHYLNMYMALQHSSNIYVARLVERVVDRLGEKWYRNQLQRFGFGEKTGLELPAESRGLLPIPGKVLPNGRMEWSKPTPFSLAMGYNLQANSIQILRAYALLANGGYLVEPTIIQKITKKRVGGKEEILLDHTVPEKVLSFPKVLDAEVLNETMKALKYATKGVGTSRRGDIPGYTEVVKTGTARKIHNGEYTRKKHLASSVGFAPIEHPAFVLIVSIDEPEVLYIDGVGNQHHGAISAAPIFKEIGKRTLEYLGITPDDPFGYPAGDPRYDASKAYWVSEANQLQEMYEKWNK